MTPQGHVFFQHIPTGMCSFYHPRMPLDLIARHHEQVSIGLLPNRWDEIEAASGQVYQGNNSLQVAEFTNPHEQFITPIRRHQQVVNNQPGSNGAQPMPLVPPRLPTLQQPTTAVARNNGGEKQQPQTFD